MRWFAIALLAGTQLLTPAWAQKRPKPNVREVERLERMTPQERRERLKQLPPERQKQIEQRMQRLQNLSPQERQRLRQRFEEFQKLSPERQSAVRDELQSLRRMSPVERKARLESGELKSRFDGRERRILNEVLRPDE
jgi:hypothetical protein